MADVARRMDQLPVPTRPAATVMLVRDGEHPTAPLEVLMVRRSLVLAFVGGAYVFPGGAVDSSDGGPEAIGLCDERDDESASAVLGIGSGGLAYWVAAVRECFEEAGVLLARRAAGGSLLSLAAPGEAGRFACHRHQVNGRRRRFVDVCAEEGLRLAVGRLHYFSHWTTPVGASRRFDTRFFVAATPPGQTPTHDAGETIASEWVRPSDALARWRAGDIDLVFPTMKNLQAIARFATAGDLLAAAAAAGDPSSVPRTVADSHGRRIHLPGDPEPAGALEATRRLELPGRQLPGCQRSVGVGGTFEG